jgi:hypothetical protein
MEGRRVDAVPRLAMTQLAFLHSAAASDHSLGDLPAFTKEMVGVGELEENETRS